MNLVLALAFLISGVGKDELLKLKKAGVDDETILAKIDQEGATALSVDEIIELKTAGISEKIIQRMLGAVRAEGKGLIVHNRSHRAVGVKVDPTAKEIRFLEGSELAGKSATELEAPDGDYAVVINGRRTRHMVSTPGEVTIRGCNIDEFEVLTAYVGEGQAKKTFLLYHKSKEAPQVQTYAIASYPAYAYGAPRGLDLSLGSSNIPLAAGIGAIIGHQSGHTWQGAAIGAGVGLLLDWYRSGW